MSITFAIRTACRARKNYLWQTVRSLISAGVEPTRIHVFPTSPDVLWLGHELCGQGVPLHVPSAPRSPNENGVALVLALAATPADWLLMLEDDVTVCADFEGSALRWLDAHATPTVHVYRFCAFGNRVARHKEYSEYPLREQRGSQAIALRAEDAFDFGQWATEHHEVWRPPLAPFQNQRTTGFDKLVGYWALSRWPAQKVGYVSEPHFVKHVGLEGSMHGRTITNEASFAGERWSYRPPMQETA